MEQITLTDAERELLTQAIQSMHFSGQHQLAQTMQQVMQHKTISPDERSLVIGLAKLWS